ncbi:MAG: hypothetical protein R3C56_25040 [Pirellulaceae bacterium]
MATTDVDFCETAEAIAADVTASSQRPCGGANECLVGSRELRRLKEPLLEVNAASDCLDGALVFAAVDSGHRHSLFQPAAAIQFARPLSTRRRALALQRSNPEFKAGVVDAVWGSAGLGSCRLRSSAKSVKQKTPLHPR